MIINYGGTIAELLPPECMLFNGKRLSESNNQHFLNEKPMFPVKDCCIAAATVLFSPIMNLKYLSD